VTTASGDRMLALMTELYPICRSLTGDGVRQTLDAIGSHIPLEIHEVPSGTQVLDWTVPDEWNIHDAYIATADGDRIVDFHASNLHVVSYSEPVHSRMPLSELRSHLHTHATRADWIPYRTSYYERAWGFCLARNVLDSLEDVEYEVLVDSTLEPGSLTYGEHVLPGELEKEVLLTTHICHPSLANDNLSGIALVTELGAQLAKSPRRLTYRLLFIPGTIGSITWLALNEERLGAITAGLVVACVGDSASLTYKRSQRGNALIDRAAAHVLGNRDEGSRVIDFVPWGWDERQFNSPGFDLPVGCFSRSREGEYEEYHTSADNLDVVDPERLVQALGAVLDIVDVLEGDRRFVNRSPRGEPQLGKRGLYAGMGGGEPAVEHIAMLWLLNQSDGSSSVLDIADRSGISFPVLSACAERLARAGLLAEVKGGE
jgi:aminopeptidase-like protein